MDDEVEEVQTLDKPKKVKKLGKPKEVKIFWISTTELGVVCCQPLHGLNITLLYFNVMFSHRVLLISF